MPHGGMHRHPRRLMDHAEILVLIQNIQRNRAFRHMGTLLRLQQSHGKPLPRREPRNGPGRPPLQKNARSLRPEGIVLRIRVAEVVNDAPGIVPGTKKSPDGHAIEAFRYTIFNNAKILGHTY